MGISGEEAGVDLAEAIEALRDSLERAWLSGRGRNIRFKPEPVELTVQVGVTRVGKGSAGVHWQVLTLGGERSRELSSVQTLRLQLTPVLHDPQRGRLEDGEQLISDVEDLDSPESRSSGDEGR
ncbi:trypco2 family protein [Streptomyces sp. NPDC056462]|uniref:trypco2 family protein n=1 Tax=Streptomyces sp. NPDC056462 TaxID=3345826 RepID=UPI0036C5D037